MDFSKYQAVHKIHMSDSRNKNIAIKMLQFCDIKDCYNCLLDTSHTNDVMTKSTFWHFWGILQAKLNQ